VVLPLEHKPSELRLVNKETARAKGHSGLYDWLSQAEAVWEEGKKTGTREDVYQWLDYMRKLSSQHPTGYHTLIYNTSGTNISSCVVSHREGIGIMGLATSGFVTEWTIYFLQTKVEEEAQFLCSFLNSSYVDRAIKPYQPKGDWGERHVSRTPFEAVPIPIFDPKDENHLKLAKLSKECHQKVAQLTLEGKNIGNLRGKVRKALANELAEIDRIVRDILS
jgi:hypothetical protein